MKKFPLQFPGLATGVSPCLRNSSSGAVLVVVLTILILVFAMAIAFLGSVITERSASASYAANTTTRQLATTAISLVQAQIEHATTQEDSGVPILWASQPGLVRTFNQDGSLKTAYKLYSDAALTSEAVDPSAMVNDLQDWASKPALFTDLNAPVGVDRDGDGQLSGNELSYPVLNPATIGASGGKSELIDGFSISAAPGATARQPAPMPVRWLYILNDGTLAPAVGSGTTATVAEATKDNPIVGRVAFWTDDDSCKLNINTAAHGTPWDIPHAMSQEEILQFAKYQPTLREFQRFPGHPATTSLAPVFGHLFGVLPKEADPYASLTVPQEQAFANFIYDIAPRVARGGSEFATVMASAPVALDPTRRLYSSLDELLFNSRRDVQGFDGGTLSGSDLTAARFFLTAHSRAPELNLFQRPRISLWPINSGDGLTTSSMDNLLAFCSTINQVPFYLQRAEPDDPASDIGLAPNGHLRDYLRSLLKQPVPGFGDSSFEDKYEADDVEQITTEILDYIRGSNIMSVTDYGASRFSKDVSGLNHTGTGVGTRGGQVSPIIDGDTKGLGRIPTISKAVLHFYVNDIIDKDNNISLVTKPPQPNTAAAIANAFVPRLDVTPQVALPKNGALGAPYNLESKAVLYFDFFDPMAGYPVSNYNFDLLVEFSGAWAVTANASTAPVQGPQPLSFPSGITRIPMRYNGYHGYDFNRDPRTGNGVNSRTQGTSYGYRLGGGRSVLAPLTGFLGFNQSLIDIVNNVTGQAGPDGLTDFYPLISAGVRLGPTLQTVQDGTPGQVKFADPPQLSAPIAIGSPEYQESFTFDGGTVKVKLVVNETGKASGSDYVIQEFEFTFPPFVKPVPSHAPYTAANLNGNAAANTQRKQMSIDSHFDYRIVGDPTYHTKLGSVANPVTQVHGQSSIYLTQPGDIVVSLEPAYGDARLIAARKKLTSTANYAGGKAQADFVPHEDYYRNGAVTDIRTRHAHSVRISAPNRSRGLYGWAGTLMHPQFGTFIQGLAYGPNAQPNLPSRFRNGVPVFKPDGSPGNYLPDFDNGPAYMQDGAYSNRADEGAVNTSAAETAWPWTGSQVVESGETKTFYSPNKQMPGAGMLGSLPTGVKRGNPWQTLLFHPDPAKAHPGSVDPPDFLIADLFWMPVVEPYAISEPFSTAGKINLNHQILPFSYINRDTALRGLMLKEEIRSIPNSELGTATVDKYKVIGTVTTVPAQLGTRTPIDLGETIKAINAHADFPGGGAYRSEAEFCSVPLIPKGSTFSADFAYESSWWKQRTATGDNLRERPYTNLLPRLTTRSNIYTVHLRVQTLGKRKSADPQVWEEGKDTVLGEYRGSSTIERYIDPNLLTSDWTTADTAPSMARYYQWRTLSTTQFAP